MGRRTRNNKMVRNLIGIFKDRASLIKAALSTKRAASSIHVAVLRASTHSPSCPPPDHCISAILSLGNGSRPTACACIAAIMDRLHTTRDAYVALKCLITLHNVIARGPFILKDQLSFFPSGGGRNFLNLSGFRDRRDTETWDLSSWVQWHAGILERNLAISRFLGTFISSPLKKINDKESTRYEITSLANSDLVRGSDFLVDMVEEICKAPDSLHHQRNDLVYEVMNFVGDDYRSTQYQILIRLSELGDRINGLNRSECEELKRSLKRLEGCRDRLSALFANKKRNNGFWDLVEETTVKLVKAEEERERRRWLVTVGRREGVGESTRSGEPVGRPSPMLMLPYGGEWLGVDRVHLTLSVALA